MGLYWFSAAYVGRLLSRDAWERLGQTAPPEWVTDTGDPRGRYIIHPPGRCINLGSIDPALEEEEVRRGFVEWSELRRALGPDRSEALRPTEEEAIKLRKYVMLASSGENDEFGVYVIQGEWSTLDTPALKRVTHNIRVV